VITLAKLRQLVPTLDAQEFQAMLRTIERTTEQNDVGIYDQLRAGAYELLRALNVAPDQVRAILLRVAPIIVSLAESIEAGSAYYPICILVIAEGRWVSWTGNMDKWYDMVCDRDAEELPHPAAYSVLCDIAAVYFRQQRKAK
jgi:hypothetical protein